MGRSTHGHVKKKALPSPIRLSTQSFPPCASTEMPRNSEPQSSPLAHAFGRRTHLVELLKDGFLLFMRYSNPGVPYDELHLRPGDRIFNGNTSLGRGELHRITEQVI